MRNLSRGPFLVGALLVASCAAEPAPDLVTRGLEIPATTPAARTISVGAPVGSLEDQEGAAVAFGAGVHFVASNSQVSPWRLRIRGADQSFLDPAISLLTSHAGECGFLRQGYPAVAFTDGVFLVAWATAGGLDHLCAQRFAADGVALDPRPILVVRTLAIDSVSVAGGAGEFLIVWNDGRQSPQPSGAPREPVDVYGIRLRASDGATLGSGEIAISAAPDVQLSPAVAFAGDQFLVAWNDRRSGGSIMGTRVRAASGSVLDPAGIPLGPALDARGWPAVAAGGEGFLVAWQDAASLGRLNAVRVRGSDGAALDAPPRELARGTAAVAAQPLFPNRPALAWGGDGYLVAWRGTVLGQTDRARMFALFLSAGGAPTGTPLLIDDAPGVTPNRAFVAQTAAFGDGKYFLTWSRRPLVEPLTVLRSKVYGVALAPGATQAPSPILLSRTAPPQKAPDVSFDGRAHLVTWREWQGFGYVVRGARVRDADGALLDSDGFAISDGAPGHLLARTASNGRSHLVVWQEGRALKATRVRGEDGARLDQPALTLPATLPGVMFDGAHLHAVASDGEDFLVAWLEGAADPTAPARVLGARITAAGQVGQATELLPLATVRDLSLTHGGGYYLLSWCLEAVGGASRVQAKRVRADGVPVEPTMEMAGNTSGTISSLARVAGDTALVIWPDGYLRARRVRMSDGTILGPALYLETAPSGVAFDPIPLGLAHDGEHFVMGTARGGNRERLPTLHRATVDGVVLDTTGIPVGGAPGYVSSSPVLSAGAVPGRLLAVHAGYQPAPLSAYRLELRLFGPTTPVPDAAAPDAPHPADAGTPPGPPDPASGVEAGAPESGVADSGEADGGLSEAPPAVADAGPGEPSEVRDGFAGADQPDALRGDGASADADDGDDSIACDCDLRGRDGGGGAGRMGLVVAVLALGLVRRRARPSGRG